MGDIKVLNIPNYSPYVDLLRKHLASVGVCMDLVGPVNYRVLRPHFKIMIHSPRYDVFHVHWIPFGSTSLMRRTIRWVRKRGLRVVWTVHNILPHEKQFRDDLGALKFMIESSDACILHNTYTMKRLKGEFGLNPNAYVIPHGNFNGYYPDYISEETARKRLGLSSESIVLLHFGQIRPYKGVDQFVELIKVLPRNFIGLIAGRCRNRSLEDLLRREADALGGRLMLHLKFVPDDEIQMYFRASDAAVFTYRDVTTSGASLLAYAFKKPVISLKTGGILEDVIHGKTGFLGTSLSDLADMIVSTDRRA